MMDVELPTWLDAMFLEAALQGGEDQYPRVTVTKFSATLAVAAGNNYTSRLYRVKVDYTAEEKKKSTSFIVKAPFTQGAIKEITDPLEFFGKEPRVYKQYLPIINRMLKFEFAPRSFYTSDNILLVLADLKEQDYDICDRYKQMDFPHCEQVLKTLAQFHAASVVCKRDHADIISLISKESMYTESEKFNTSVRGWLEAGLKIVAGLVEAMQLGNEAVDFILSRAETVADSALRLCKPKATGLNVLNHGDLWSSNVLFKYTRSGDIVDVRFIDYQICRYCSPALDLLYFIWSSANEDVRDGRLTELFEIYRLTLNSTLESLGCQERLTEEELKKDLRDAEDWAIIVICGMLPVIMSDAEDILNTENYTPEDPTDAAIKEKYYRLYNGKCFRALLPKIMEQMLRSISSYK